MKCAQIWHIYASRADAEDLNSEKKRLILRIFAENIWNNLRKWLILRVSKDSN